MRNYISSYVHGIGGGYCEVPIRDVSPDDIPMLYGGIPYNTRNYIVNIYDEFFTYVRFGRNLSCRVIKHSNNGNINYRYRIASSATGIARYERLWLSIGVPDLCGCGLPWCDGYSDRFYVIFISCSEKVHVLSIDSLPARIVGKKYDRCTARWIMKTFENIAHEIVLVRRYDDIECYVHERCSSSDIFRMCNATFLKHLSLEDFKAEVERRKRETTDKVVDGIIRRDQK
jgi:hypothetical protein